MGAGGIALRVGGIVLRFTQFAAALVILGIFSYFLAIQSKQGIYIVEWVRAVEGLAGATALYTLFGVILTFFLGGVPFFAVLAIVLDFCFLGASIAIVYETRGGNRNCKIIQNEDPLRLGPDGLGDPSQHSYVPNTYHSCNLLKASFALGAINMVLFVISICYQLVLIKHHRKVQRHGAGPNVPVSAGQKRPFWKRGARADIEKNYPYRGALGLPNSSFQKPFWKRFTQKKNAQNPQPFGYGQSNNAVNY